jgi:GDSL-like Lipase/Acylhydrolase family
MRGAGPLLAALSAAVTLLVLEGAVRVRLSPANREALPHVGVDAEAQRRLEWVERGRAARGADAWQIDIPDPLLGWRPKPGIVVRSVRPGSYDVTVTTNPQGLRGGRPALRAKRAGTNRIAVFGCSQTFGSGVEDDETFSARVESSLRDVEVLNFGVHGYGTDQMLLRWEREGIDYAPDVVVLAFAYYHLDRNVSGFRFFAKPRFALAADGSLRLEGVPVPDPDALARDGSRIAPWPLADRSVLLRWLWDRDLRRRQAALYQAEGPAWELTRALIARFADTAHRRGTRMILLNIDEDAPWLSAPLAQVAADHGIAFADAEPALGPPRSRGVRLRLPGDPHWNPQGHAIIADVLRGALCARGGVAGCATASPEGARDEPEDAEPRDGRGAHLEQGGPPGARE